MQKTLKIIEEWILILCVLALAVVSVVNVIGRTFFSHSLESGEELSVIFIVALTFLGIGYCAREDRHIKMSALLDYLPKSAGKPLTRFINGVTGLMFFALVPHAVEYTRVVQTLESKFPVLGFPIYYLYWLIPIGFILAGIQYTILTINPANHVHEAEK